MGRSPGGLIVAQSHIEMNKLLLALAIGLGFLALVAGSSEEENQVESFESGLDREIQPGDRGKTRLRGRTRPKERTRPIGRTRLKGKTRHRGRTKPRERTRQRRRTRPRVRTRRESLTRGRG